MTDKPRLTPSQRGALLAMTEEWRCSGRDFHGTAARNLASSGLAETLGWWQFRRTTAGAALKAELLAEAQPAKPHQ